MSNEPNDQKPSDPAVGSSDVLCRACGYSGSIDTYHPCLTSMWNDCRCPKCGSTNNEHNSEYQRVLSEALSREQHNPEVRRSGPDATK